MVTWRMNCALEGEFTSMDHCMYVHFREAGIHTVGIRRKA